MKTSNGISTFIFKYFFIGAIAVLLATAVVTRFYRLGDVPAGLTWDEAAIGYNGHAIFTTRRDEWLIKLPVSFRSFGDYKAPFSIYLNGIFTYIFGMNSWGVRVPFAIAGVVFVFAVGALISEVFQGSRFRKEAILIGMLLTVLSPWHFHFSRVGFESGIAVTLITLGLASVLMGKRMLLERNHLTKVEKLPYLAIVGGAILLVLSLYTYHSAKITVPFLVLYILIQLWSSIKVHWVFFISVLLMSILLLYPLLQDTLYGSGATRANVLLFSQQLSSSEIATTALTNIVKHFSPDFILFGSVDSARHGAGRWGVLSVTTVGLILALAVSSFYKMKAALSSTRQVVVLGVVLMIAGILPAALSAETVPHSNRAMLALPGFILLAVTGFTSVLEIWGRNSQLVCRLFIGLVIFIECSFFFSFWQQYFRVFAVESVSAFQEGYVAALEIARDYEKGVNGKPEVDKVIVSTEYGQPYIYALFVKKPSPIAYQGGTLYKYEFSDVISPSDLERNNTLILATPKNKMPTNSATEIIYGTDGSIRFQIYYTGRK